MASVPAWQLVPVVQFFLLVVAKAAQSFLHKGL
jgi:hypothetical protein